MSAVSEEYVQSKLEEFELKNMEHVSRMIEESSAQVQLRMASDKTEVLAEVSAIQGLLTEEKNAREEAATKGEVAKAEMEAMISSMNRALQDQLDLLSQQLAVMRSGASAAQGTEPSVPQASGGGRLAEDAGVEPEDPWAKSKWGTSGEKEKSGDQEIRDPDLKKNVWARKGFDRRLKKFTNEGGETAFRDWAFDLKKITKGDRGFRDFLQWLEELREEVTEDLLVATGKKFGWDAPHLNEQLYGILAEVCDGRAKSSVVTQENDVKINGAAIYRDLAREYLDASRAGTVALGERLTSPPQAAMDEFEERLMDWDVEKDRYKRMTGIDCANELGLVYLQKMMPEEVKKIFEAEKHNILNLEQLRVCSPGASPTTRTPRRRRSRGAASTGLSARRQTRRTEVPRVKTEARARTSFSSWQAWSKLQKTSGNSSRQSS